MVPPRNRDPAPVDRRQALAIARLACTGSSEVLTIHEALPPGCSIYGVIPSDGPCWFVTAPGCQGTRVGAGRLVVVSKRTGRVLYCGSDGGE